MFKIVLFVTHNEDESNYPPGFEPSHTISIELFINCEDKNEACLKAIEQCKQDFPECEVEIFGCEKIDKPKAQFKQIDKNQQPSVSNQTKKRLSKPERIGKKRED